MLSTSFKSTTSFFSAIAGSVSFRSICAIFVGNDKDSSFRRWISVIGKSSRMKGVDSKCFIMASEFACSSSSVSFIGSSSTIGIGFLRSTCLISGTWLRLGDVRFDLELEEEIRDFLGETDLMCVFFGIVVGISRFLSDFTSFFITISFFTGFAGVSSSEMIMTSSHSFLRPGSLDRTGDGDRVLWYECVREVAVVNFSFFTRDERSWVLFRFLVDAECLGDVDLELESDEENLRLLRDSITLRGPSNCCLRWNERLRQLLSDNKEKPWS